MIFSTKYEIFIKFARKAGFHTFLYIVEFSPLGPKNRSDSIRNGKSTPKIYFQAAYMNVDFPYICEKSSRTPISTSDTALET